MTNEQISSSLEHEVASARLQTKSANRVTGFITSVVARIKLAAQSTIVRYFVVAFWSVGVAAGTWFGVLYESTPTQTQIVGGTWPAETKCILSSGRPTLLMFVHPRCACSQASLSELSALISECRGLVDAQVLVLKPALQPVEWSQSELWDQANQIPEVVVHLDIDGIEHERFKANVSGEVFLYSPRGNLVFHGGITPARGHRGDNRGTTTGQSHLIPH